MASLSLTHSTKLDKAISTVVHRVRTDKRVSAKQATVSYTQFLQDKMLMIQVIREGVPYSLFELIQNQTPFTEETWAKMLDISTKSLQRYKQSNKSFKSIQSEKIIEIAEVTHLGVEVFGEVEKFKLWLDTPNFSLGKMKPVELLNDSYGKELVMTELTHINHGILA
jgi:putative toxin-antitoxin system antitoxin component (TIGR02293 family)